MTVDICSLHFMYTPAETPNSTHLWCYTSSGSHSDERGNSNLAGAAEDGRSLPREKQDETALIPFISLQDPLFPD
jgi:hypothetical protein